MQTTVEIYNIMAYICEHESLLPEHIDSLIEMLQEYREELVRGKDTTWELKVEINSSPVYDELATANTFIS